MTLSRRVNNISPFIRGVMRDDNRYQGGHIGFVTYADDDTYQVSYIEAGVRSDHVGAPLAQALGAPLDVTERDAEREKELLRAVAERTKPSNLTNPTTAFAAASFLRTYGQQLAMDAAQARAAITHKLMELANCGDPRYELKALELLGKHSDIGIFTERSEITVSYKNPEELEQAIKNRVKNLLNAQVVDVLPLEGALDEKLGVLEDTKEMRTLDAALGVITPTEEEDDDIPL